jgi:hypothetical protein
MTTLPSSAFAGAASGIDKPKAANVASVNAILRIFSSIIPMMNHLDIQQCLARKIVPNAFNAILKVCSDYDFPSCALVNQWSHHPSRDSGHNTQDSQQRDRLSRFHMQYGAAKRYDLWRPRGCKRLL